MNFRIFIRIFYNNSRVDDVLPRKKKIEYILSAITFINIANRIFSRASLIHNGQVFSSMNTFVNTSAITRMLPLCRFTSCRTIFRANLTFLLFTEGKTTISISISKDLRSRSIVFHFKRFFPFLFFFFPLTAF